MEDKKVINVGTGILIGIVIGILTSPYLPQTFGNYKKGYQTGFSDARNMVETSIFGDFFRVQEDVRSVSGTVVSINGNMLTIHGTEINPFDISTMGDRGVTVSADTKIFRLTDSVPRAPVTISASAPAASPGGLPGQASVGFSNIKVGDSVTAIASENIKNAAEFTAREVQIRSKTQAK